MIGNMRGFGQLLFVRYFPAWAGKGGVCVEVKDMHEGRKLVGRLGDHQVSAHVERVEFTPEADGFRIRRVKCDA